MASSSSVKYQWPSTVNVANFVTVKPWLNKDNKERSILDYKVWKEQMVCLLESQDLLGFIDGETPLPPPGKLWRITDRLIKGWILGSIGNDALDAVVGMNSSREVWLELENVFNIQMKADTNEVRNQASDGVDENGTAKDEDGIVEIGSEPPSNGLDQGNVVSGKDINSYLQLHKAALRGDWEEGKKFLNENKEGTTAILNGYKETPLQIAMETGNSNGFVRELLKIIPEDALAWKNIGGDTALHLAAMVGNTEAVTMLVNKNPELQYILNNKKFLPVHLAVMSCHKETVKYLITMSRKDVENSPFVGELGAVLLGSLIASEFVDVALSLVKKYPNMATLKDWENDSVLKILAGMGSLFPSGESLSWWQNWMYSRIPLEPSTATEIKSDIEKSLSIDDRANKFSWSEVACRGITCLKLSIKGGKLEKPSNKLNVDMSLNISAISGVMSTISSSMPELYEKGLKKVTCVKRSKDKKIMHQQALELTKFLCERTASLTYNEAEPIFKSSIIKAAHHGIHELVEVIIEMFPEAVFTREAKTRSNIFLLAARKRLDNVFNLIYLISDKKHIFFDSKDSSGNNFMHMCAKLAPPDKLNLVSGAALQMQRELQWFKEMEKFVNPSRRMWHNKDGLTAKMLFTKEHNELKVAGEIWMKDTARSCSIAAALIATVVFSAAFNVPGNVSSDTGIPILLHETLFVLFNMSDSVSLFTSTTSLLMFLSILTSRYAEEDFLYILPKRLCMGLITLFTSIIFMMISFTIAIYITLHHKSKLLIIPVALLACLPIATFAFLQFPLLIAVLYSTYGPGIVGKKSDRTLH